MSFSAHADGFWKKFIFLIVWLIYNWFINLAKGILELIKHSEPKNVMLVHGEKKRMDILS